MRSMNLLPDGFLSNVLEHWISDTRSSSPEWFSLVFDVNRGAVHILTTLAPSRTSDRELMAAALFARALQSFEGSILLAERGMLADAGALARSVVECAVFLGGVAYVEGFTQRMVGDNNKHYYKMAKAVAEQLEQWDDDGHAEDAKELRALISEVDEQGHKRSSINLQQLAKEIGMGPLYEFVYRRLSGDAAHPTIASLERHVGRGDIGQLKKLTFSPQREGLESILSASIFALLAAMDALVDVFARQDIRDKVATYNTRHHALSPSSADS